MLREIQDIDQKEHGVTRRWFVEDTMDLLVWLNDEGLMHGFQLCYTRERNRFALTWFKDQGYSHNRIDENDDKIGRKRGTPLLVGDGVLQTDLLAEEFKTKSVDIEPGISVFVLQKIGVFN